MLLFNNKYQKMIEVENHHFAIPSVVTASSKDYRCMLKPLGKSFGAYLAAKYNPTQH